MSKQTPPALATVTVTYHPDAGLLSSQLSALPADARKVVVDNGTPEHEWIMTAHRLESVAGVEVLRLGRNLGLAAALNKGIAHLEKTGEEPFVLLLDQDSEPDHGAAETMTEAFRALEAGGRRVGAIGPALLDPSTGLQHGFHVQTALRWKRIYPAEGAAPVRCTSLNGSGTLMRIETWRKLGGLDESLFIDHVDTEWSFRLLAAGYGLWGIPSAKFVHRMGDASIRFWAFGWRLWPSRSPQRHYYLFRNAVSLIRRGYVPRVWKTWAVIKLGLTFGVQSLYDPARFRQWACMWRGIKDGFGLKPYRKILDANNTLDQ